MVKLKNCTVMPKREVDKIVGSIGALADPPLVRQLFKKANNPDYKLSKAHISAAQTQQLLQQNGCMDPYVSAVLSSGGSLHGDEFIFKKADLYKERY